MIASRVLLNSQRRRVVVTGIGAITPLGNDFPSTWKNLLSPSSSSSSSSSPTSSIGITTLEEAMLAQNLPPEILDYEMDLAKMLPSQVAAPVRGVEYCPRTNRFVQLALIAAAESLKDAGLDTWLEGINDKDDSSESSDSSSGKEQEGGGERRSRIGTCIGSGMSSVREIIAAHSTVSTKKSLRRLSPHFVPKVLCNSAAARVSLEHSLRGPNLAPSTACAAGGHAIGDALRCIQHDDADIMLCGGAEACIDPISMGGFARLKALSTMYNDEPLRSSRPFDKERDGFVMGEGSCVMVIEELDHALKRGANIYCEVAGYGLSGDGYHVTSPDPEGRGAERAMRIALERAGIEPHIVDYVNAHATSTPMGDEIEERTVARVVAQGTEGQGREKNLYVSSTKGATGHLLGAAGAIEGAFTVMAIKDGIVPPTRNLENNGFKGFHHVKGSPIEDNIKVAVSNSFGFGGTNASVVFSSLDLGL